MTLAYISFDNGICRRLREQRQESHQVADGVRVCVATGVAANLLDENYRVTYSIRWTVRAADLGGMAMTATRVCPSVA